MVSALTVVIVGLSTLALLMAGVYAWRDRLINDPLLLVLALAELGVIVQAVVALVRVTQLAGEKATFAAYALTLPFLLPFATWMAIKEKSRWAMVTIGVGAFAVAVMTYRMHQIWSA